MFLTAARLVTIIAITYHWYVYYYHYFYYYYDCGSRFLCGGACEDSVPTPEAAGALHAASGFGFRVQGLKGFRFQGLGLFRRWCGTLVIRVLACKAVLYLASTRPDAKNRVIWEGRKLKCLPGGGGGTCIG